ncbi:MAG: C40 family peptidase [Methylovirgula sp.]
MTELEERARIFGDPSQQRDRIIIEARKWIGTPYHNCADVLGVGVDCGMLIVRSFVDSGLCAPFDPRPYPPDWHLHRGEERYLGFVFDRCAETEDPGLGDVIVFRYGRCYSHGGIVTRVTPLTFVHAYWPAKAVVEEELHRNIQLSIPARAHRFFSYWKKSASSSEAIGNAKRASSSEAIGDAKRASCSEAIGDAKRASCSEAIGTQDSPHVAKR